MVESQDRLIYAAYEDRADGELRDDDAVLGSNISLGGDSYAEDLVISFDEDGTRIAEDQQYQLVFTNLTTQDKVVITVNGVEYELTVGVDVDGNSIAAEDGAINDNQIAIQAAFLARLEGFINSFMDDDTAAGQITAAYQNDSQTLVLTQAAYDGEETVFMSTPTVAMDNASGGEGATCTVLNNSNHEVQLLDFDGRDNELNAENVLFIGDEGTSRAILETADDDAASTTTGSEAILVDNGVDTHADTVANTGAEVTDSQATNAILDAAVGIYAVHGDDLLIGGDADDTINAGTGDDRVIGSLGTDTIDGGNNFYAVQVLGEDSVRVYELNNWQSQQDNWDEVEAFDGLTITSVQLINQTEANSAIISGRFGDTLQFEQADFVAGETEFTITLDDFNVDSDGVVNLENDGAGTVQTDVDGDGVFEATTTFTNFENIRTVSGVGKAVAGNGQGNDTLNVVDLSDETGGISYNLTNDANAGNVMYSKDSANNVIGLEAGQDEAEDTDATVKSVKDAILAENITQAFRDAVNDITIISTTSISGFLSDVEDLPELTRPTSGLDASTIINASDYEELVIRVDGVEQIDAGTGNDLLLIDETEAAKDNTFNAGEGDDRIEYRDVYGTNPTGAEPIVTIAVNAALDTDTVSMTSGRVGTTVSTDTLVDVEYITLEGNTAQSDAEADVLDVTAMEDGAVVDYTNGEIREQGALAGNNVELVIEGITQLENVWADGDDTVIIADDMINAREDVANGTAPEDIILSTYLDYDDLTEDNVRQAFGAEPADITQVVNQGQYTFELSKTGSGEDNDIVDYKAETGDIVAVADFDADVDTQYILVDNNGNGNFTEDGDRVDELVGVENAVASQGESVLDLTNATQDLKITFSSNYDREADYDAGYAAGNGLEVHQISVTGDAVGDPELLEMNYLDYVFVDTTPEDPEGDPAVMQSVYWNTIEGSDYNETAEMSGYEAGEVHTLNLRGGQNQVNYEGNEVNVTISIVDWFDSADEWDDWVDSLTPDEWDDWVNSVGWVGGKEYNPAQLGRVNVAADHFAPSDEHDEDQSDDAIVNAVDVITSYSAQNEIATGSLTIKGARFDDDSIAFADGLDSKFFVLGGVVDATNAITVTIGEEEDANSLLLVGFEELADAETDDVYQMGDLDNVLDANLVLVDNLVNDRDTLIAYDDARDEDNDGDDDTINLASLENELYGFDFDVLDLTKLTEDDVTVIGDAADAELQEIIVGDFDTINSDAGEGISNFDQLTLTAASDPTAFILDLDSGELQSSGGTRYFDFDGNRIDVSAMTGQIEITVEDTAGIGTWITGSAQNDEFTGGTGDDYIIGGAGNDVIDGGSAAEVRYIEIEGANVLEDDGNNASFNFMGQGNLVLVEGSADLVAGAGPQAVVDALAKILDNNLEQATEDFQAVTGSDARIVDVSNDGGKLTFTFNDGTDVLGTQLIDLGFSANGDTGDLTVSANHIFSDGGTGGDNIFYGGLGVDDIQGGGGSDQFVVIGTLEEGDYNAAAGAAAVLELGDILTAAKADSDVSTDSYDGGDGVDTLEIWGTADFSKATIKDIEIADIHSEVTFTQEQIDGFTTFLGVTGSVVNVLDEDGDTTEFTYDVDEGGFFDDQDNPLIPEAPNTAPVAVADTFTTDVDIPISIDVLANDTDADSDDVLSIAAVQAINPAIGTVAVDNGEIVFTPAAGYTGDVTFNYRITDGIDFGTGSVTGTVTEPNEAPVAVADTFTTEMDIAISIPVLDNDTDADLDALSIAVVQAINPAIGTVAIDNGEILFTPAAGYTGDVTFNYRITDGIDFGIGSVTGTVTSGPIAVTEDVTGPNATPYNASTADVTFNFTQGNYTYSIDGFDSGDILDVLDTGGLGVSNASDTDGILELTVADGDSGTTLEITLMGVDLTQDAAIFNVASFNAAFGTGSFA